MGAKWSTDLMSDVNLLIVGDRHTPKYEYSVKNRYDIIFIKPNFFINFYEKWINGDNINFKNDLILNGLLGIFQDMNICIAKTPTLSSKSKYNYENENLKQIILKNGGIVEDSLSLKTTHLITTLKKGKRFLYATKWNIPILHPKWILKSIERGAALEEKYYDILNIKNDNDNDEENENDEENDSDEEIGKDSCTCWDKINSKDMNDKNDNNVMETLINNINNDKFNKSESNLDSEIFIPRKKTSLWNNIMDHLNLNIIKKRKNDEESSWDTIESPIKKQKLITNLISSSPIPKSSFNNKNNDDNDNEIEIEKKGIFNDCIFELFGFDSEQIQKLTNVIISHDGIILSKSDTITIPTHFLIYSNLSPSKAPDFQTILKKSSKIKIITQWCIERSIYYKKLKIDKWSNFFQNHSIKKFKILKISISGFNGIELLHITKLICEILGDSNNLIDFFTKNCDLLIISSNCKNPRKLNFAKNWNIPIVNENWLFNIANELNGDFKLPLISKK